MTESMAFVTFTKFERHLLALALEELGDRRQHIRGLPAHIARLAAKLGLDDSVAARAKEWIESERRLNPARAPA